MSGVDSDGTDIIEFGLAKKSQDVLIAHMKGLTSLENSIKSMVKPGAGGAFSGQFLQVLNKQLVYQKDIAQGIRQLNMQLTKGAGLQRQQAALVSSMNQKAIQNALVAFGKQSGTPTKTSLWSKIGDFFKGLPGMLIGGLKKGFSIISKAWEKTGGALFKKTGQMGINKLLGLGGLTVVGALMGKMISSSPLLQAMFKILNTSLTLIMRPIGDFFGAFFRPMFIYFLKEVAIPFFQQGRGWMKEGEKWGRIAVGFFIDPITAIGAAMVKSFSVISGWLMKGLYGIFGAKHSGEGYGREIDPATGEFRSVGKLAEAEYFHKDPAAWMRWKEGLTGGPAPWSEMGEQFEELGGFSDATTTEIEKLNDIIAELEKQNDILLSGVAIAGGQHRPIQYGMDYPYGQTMIGDMPFGDSKMLGGNSAIEVAEILKAYFERLDLASKGIDVGSASLAGNFIVPKADPNKFNPPGWDEDVPYGYGYSKAEQRYGQGTSPEPGSSLGWWDMGLRLITAFFKPSNMAKFSLGFIGASGAGFPGGGMTPGTTLDEINENIEQYNNQSKEQVEDTKESFTRIAMDTAYIQDLIENSANYSKNISESVHGTMSTVDLYNKRIETDWGVTAEQMDLHSNKYIEDLFELGLVFHQMKLRGEEMSLNDELRANALLLGNDIRLKEIDKMVDTSKHIGSNLDLITDELDRALHDFIGYQHLNQTIARITFNELATGANTLLKLLGSESTITTDPGTPKSFSVADASSFGRQWLEKNVDSSGSASGAVYSLMENAGGPNENAYAAGVEGPLLGGMNEFSYWLGPEGQFSRSGVGVNKGVLGENAWTQVADYETAANVAEAYKNQSLAAVANEIRKKQSDAVKAFTGNQAAIYLAAGGGATGIAAAQLAGSGGAIPGVNQTGPSFGSWEVSQGGALGQAIAESKEANPAAWAAAVGYSTGGNNNSGGGGGGGYTNRATSTGGVASASPGYSGPGAQFGGIIDEPIVGVGMHSGREWRLGESGSELVTPLNQIGDGGNAGNIIIHIGNISKEADYMKLKPLIQRWILEASSRRGMV
jgi:hypothetical protein